MPTTATQSRSAEADTDHLAHAVACLASKLAESHITCQPNDISLFGALDRAILIDTGGTSRMEFFGQPPMTIRFR